MFRDDAVFDISFKQLGHSGFMALSGAIEGPLPVAGFGRQQANGDGCIQGQPQCHAGPDKCHRHDAHSEMEARCAVICLNP
jgi:hypothetical protein